MNTKSITIVFLLLLAVTTAKGEVIDSLQMLVLHGDNCAHKVSDTL